MYGLQSYPAIQSQTATVGTFYIPPTTILFGFSESAKRHTVDWDVFVVKSFCRSPSTTKIKPAKYFLPGINRVSLFRCMVVITTKIKPHEI